MKFQPSDPQRKPISKKGLSHRQPPPATDPLQRALLVQNAMGNQAMRRLVQAKLKIGPPDDAYEREADRVADQVMRLPQPQGQSRPGPLPTGEVRAKPLAGQITPLLQRQEEEEPVPQAMDDESELRQVAPLPVPEEKEEEEAPQEAANEEEEEGPAQMVQAKPLAVQRLCPECKKKLQRNLSSGAGSVGDGHCPECRAELMGTAGRIQRQSAGNGALRAPDSLESAVQRVVHSPGRPLSEESRGFAESSFGRGFSGVRLHDDAHAARTAQAMGAKAFTIGSNIAFGAGQLQEKTLEGRKLLAHELTHVVQQGAADAGPVQAQRVQRQEEGYQQPVFEPTEADYAAMDEGDPVERAGIVQTDDGTNLWPQTDRSKPKLGLLPQNTRLWVDRKIGKGWYEVYVEKHQRGFPLPVVQGTHGYVDASRVNIDMPDPDAWLYRIEQNGQGALAVAREVYRSNFKASWGKDFRYLVNVLSSVNESKGRRFLYKEDPEDSWDEAKTKAGQIWVPGLKLVDALHGQLSSGSISYEVLTTLGEITIGVAAFIVGLLHGALSSVADIFVGAYDLVKMVGDIIVKLFRGTLISDAKGFYDDISKIKISDIIAMVGAKWNAPSIWDRWKFRGYVIGYAVVEVLLLIFSVGVITAVKWAGKAGKLGKLSSYLAKLPRVEKLTKAAKGLKGKTAEKMRKAMKAANALSEAHGWAASALRIPMQILRRLSKADIAKLKRLPQWAREEFSRLATRVKLRLLGCSSPCDVDFRKIQKHLRDKTAKGVRGAKLLNTPEEVLAALPANLNKSKISIKLRKKNSALMTAIREAGIKDKDFARLADFLPDGRVSRGESYKYFVSYMTGLVPARVGRNIKKLNKVLDTMIAVEKGRGAAMKGPIFEKWIALHVPKLKSRTFTRINFDVKKLLKKKKPPLTREADKWVSSRGEIWEIKHQFSKVPDDQAADWFGLVGKTAPDGAKVKSVQYIFPTKGAAQVNKHLSDTYGFAVYYIDEATNHLRKLY